MCSSYTVQATRTGLAARVRISSGERGAVQGPRYSRGDIGSSRNGAGDRGAGKGGGVGSCGREPSSKVGVLRSAPRAGELCGEFSAEAVMELLREGGALVGFGRDLGG